jgi:hypothetical protein
MNRFHNWGAEPGRGTSLDSLGAGISRVFGTVDLAGDGEERRPVFRPRGPLARSGSEQPLPLVAGVGFVTTVGGGGELIVWSDAPGVHLSPAGDSLTLEGLTAIGSVVIVEMRIQVARIVVKRLDEALVWPERIVRMAGFGARLPGEWAYPDCPVRTEIWPYVVAMEGPTLVGEEILWSVELLGGRRLVKRVRIGGVEEEAVWDSIGSPETDDRGMLAIWPRLRLPGWRLYSLVVGDDAEDALWRSHRPQLWLGASPAEARRAAPEATVHRRNGLVVLLLDAAHAHEAPFFISLTGHASSGFYQLLEPAAGRAAGAAAPESDAVETVAIDLGTSTTVVAVANGEVLRAGGNGLALPRVVVGNAPGAALCTTDPWLPTVAGTYMAIDGAFAVEDEIPTGLFVRGRDGIEFPFRDFTLCAPGLDLVTAGYGADSWISNLKWGSADAEIRPLTVNFLATVLLWMAALRWHAARQFDVRASYPLSFSLEHRKTYGKILAEACALASEWSGAEIALATTRRAEAHPYCDESLALLHGVGEEMTVFEGHHDAGTGRLRIVVHADLGAETLDLMLTWLSGASYKVIAADSIRFGADTLLDCLQSETSTKRQQQVEARSAEGDQVHRYQVRRAVRAGYLPRVMASQSSKNTWDLDPTLPPANLVWAGKAQEARYSVQARMDLYAYLLAEYCARFVAGALLDREGFLYRASDGPGSGEPGEARLEEGCLILIRRSGNGWKFLRSALCGWSDEEWLETVKERSGNLIGKGVNVEFMPGAVDKALLAKSVTAEGTLACKAAVVENAVGPEASPNGWDDADQRQKESIAPWWVLVGSGSLVRRPRQESDPRDFPHLFYAGQAMQQTIPTAPGFPAANGATLRPRTIRGQELWRQAWVDGLAKQRDARERWLRECRELQKNRAAADGGVSCRVKATGSAMWETLLRGIVTRMEPMR